MEDSHPSSHKDKGFFRESIQRLSAAVLAQTMAMRRWMKSNRWFPKGQEMGVLEDEEAKMINNIF